MGKQRGMRVVRRGGGGEGVEWGRGETGDRGRRQGSDLSSKILISGTRLMTRATFRSSAA